MEEWENRGQLYAGTKTISELLEWEMIECFLSPGGSERFRITDLGHEALKLPAAKPAKRRPSKTLESRLKPMEPRLKPLPPKSSR